MPHHWVARHQDKFIAPLVLGAVVASFLVSNHDSKARDRDQAAQLVRGCDRSSEKSILDAAYKQTTSDVRRSTSKHKGDADWKAANKYERFALGSIALVPLPPDVVKAMADGRLDPSKALIRAVVVRKDSAGKPIYRVSEQARKILHQGCVEAYS